MEKCGRWSAFEVRAGSLCLCTATVADGTTSRTSTYCPPDDDCAFTVIFQSGDGLVIKADRRHRVGTVSRMTDIAGEFLGSAQANLDGSRLHPFVDDLLAAVELVAKGYLYWCFETRFWKPRSHQTVKSRLYESAYKGDVPRDYAQLQRRLLELRRSARYGEGALDLSTGEAAEMLQSAMEKYQGLIRTGSFRRWDCAASS